MRPSDAKPAHRVGSGRRLSGHPVVAARALPVRLVGRENRPGQQGHRLVEVFSSCDCLSLGPLPIA